MKYKFFIGLVFFAAFGINSYAQVVVTLDYYFNHETRKNAAGEAERFHYLWEDKSNTGFSILGDAFKQQGGILKSLHIAPTLNNLKGTGIYIIVDPDTKKESPLPNYINANDINEIDKWVKAGGVLFLLANDSANVEMQHFNGLAKCFGMHFNDDMQNHVIDDAHFEDGAISTTNYPVFKSAQKVFIKDACSITLSDKATAVLKNKNGAVIIAGAKHGKGYVLAVGDPWLYNEYTNGRLPAGFDNDRAATDIVKYLISKTKQ